MKKFVVVEDNLGFIRAYTLEGKRVVCGVAYLEYSDPGAGWDDYAALVDDPGIMETWDGQIVDVDIDPQDSYENDTMPGGADIIADDRGVYPQRMGVAGRLYFGLD